MNKDEFLRQLELLLSDVSVEEKADALAYYRSYFEDAGEGNEASIIEELESPKKVAESIKRDLGMIAPAEGELHSESSYDAETAQKAQSTQSEHASWEPWGRQNEQTTQDTRGGQNERAPQGMRGGQNEQAPQGMRGGQNERASQGMWSGKNEQASQGMWSGQNDQTSQNTWTNADRDAEYYKNVNDTINNLKRENKNSNTVILVLGIALAVMTCPAWLGILLGIFGMLFGITAAVVSVTAALLITGIILVGSGIGCLFSGSIVVGFGLAGAGMIILALGLLSLILTVWIFGGFLPWACRGIGGLCRKLYRKGKGRAAI